MTPAERERAALFKRAAYPRGAGAADGGLNSGGSARGGLHSGGSGSVSGGDENFGFRGYAATHFAPRSAGWCCGQGLTLVPFSAQPEPFLTQIHPEHPLNDP
jgi:hypothetical protein